MDFLSQTDEVYQLIKASATFAADQASVLCKDFGTKKSFIEAALDITSTPPGKGYAVSVWPPARGHSDQEYSGASGVDAVTVVRFEVNPQMLLTLAAQDPPVDEEAWLNNRLSDLISAVLGGSAAAGGIKYQLAADAFELVNFDEGLVAYHIRFVKLSIFGG